MKNKTNLYGFFSAICLMLLSVCSYAQTDAIDYQTIITDIQNLPIKSTNIEVRIEVIEASQNGNVTYTEIHQVMTGINGELSLEIGKGTADNSSFSDINWGIPNYIAVSVKPDGGSIFLSNGNIELLSVPYAIFATKLGCEQGCPGADGKDGPQGAQGEQGINGINGSNGITGLDGLNGIDGIDGHETLNITNNIPQSPLEGEFYLDDGTNRSDGQPGFRYYSNGNWINI